MEAVELLSHVNEKFGTALCSTSVGNFIALLQENQVGLFSLRSDDFLKQYFVNVYILMLWFCRWTSLICHSLQVSFGIFKWKQSSEMCVLCIALAFRQAPMIMYL